MDIFDGQHTDVWVYDWARDTLSRLTFGPGDSGMPVWTPDGRRIVFRSNRADNTFNLYSSRSTARSRGWSEGRFALRRLRAYDLHPDGERFAVRAAPETAGATKQDKVVLIFNFFDELRRIAPVMKR